MSAVETKNAITLKGSSKMICEYLSKFTIHIPFYSTSYSELLTITY